MTKIWTLHGTDSEMGYIGVVNMYFLIKIKHLDIKVLKEILRKIIFKIFYYIMKNN